MEDRTINLQIEFQVQYTYMIQVYDCWVNIFLRQRILTVQMKSALTSALFSTLKRIEVILPNVVVQSRLFSLAGKHFSIIL